MTTVNLILSGQGPAARSIRSVLIDWSALGLIRPFLWISADSAQPGGVGALRGSLVTDGQARPVAVQTHLANQIRLARVRVGALSLLGGAEEPASASLADELRNALEALVPDRVTPLQVMVVRHGEGGWRDDRGWFTWHNVVVAPEDAYQPGGVPHPVDVGLDAPAFASHAAAGLAALLGLWTGMEAAPLDGEPRPPEAHCVVARSYVRRLDAGRVEEGLRATLTAMSRGLPRPRQGGEQLPYFDHPQPAAEQVARSLADKHAGLLNWRPMSAPSRPLVPMNWRKVLALFFSFLAAAIRNAPREWLAAVRRDVSVGAARRLQEGILGGDQSQIEVIVAGYTARGLLATADDLAGATDVLATRADPFIPVGEARLPYLNLFWKDFIAGGLMLADGEQHTGEMPPPFAGDRPGVVRRPEQIAPPPEDTFVVPENLASEVGISTLAPYDDRQILLLKERLESHIERGDHLARDAGKTLDDLGDWYRVRSRTYVGAVARRLSKSLRDTAEAVAGLFDRLGDMSRESDLTEIERTQRSLARTLRLLAALAGVAVIAVVLLAVLRTLSLALGAVLVVLVVVSWFTASLVAFYRRQTTLFQLLHAREQEEPELELLKRNLGEGMAALRRSSVMYAQLLVWAPVLGRFLGRPFGEQSRSQRPELRVSGTLPRSVWLGVAHPDPDAIAVAAHRLSASLLQSGWLAGVWADVLKEAPGRLGTDGLGMEGNGEELYRDRATRPDSLLRRWSDSVVTTGVGSAAGNRLWNRAQHIVVADGLPNLTQGLLREVEVTGHQSYTRADSNRRSGRDFIFGITNDEGEGEGERFHLDLFTPSARNDGAWRVKSNVLVAADEVLGADEAARRPGTRLIPASTDAVSGLNQFVLLVQFSGQLPGYDLQLLAPRPVPAEREPTEEGVGEVMPPEPSGPFDRVF